MKKVFRIIANIGYMFKYSWNISKSGFFVAIVNILLDTVEPLILLLIPARIIDELVSGKEWNTVLKYIFLLILTMTIFKLIRALMNVVSNLSYDQCRIKNGFAYAAHFLHMDYENLENGAMRDKQMTLSQHVNAFVFIHQNFKGTLTSLLQLISYSYIIFTLHPVMIAVILLLIGAFSLVSKRRENINYKFQPIITKVTRRLNYLFNIMISYDYGKEIRINNADRWLDEKYKRESADFIQKNRINQKKQLFLGFIDLFISGVQTGIMYGYCAVKVINGSISLGSFSVYIGAITNFTGAFTSFVNNVNYTVTVMKYVNDYKKYIESTHPSWEKKSTEDIINKDFSEHEIEFKNVSFHYPNCENMVLKNVSLKIKSGNRLAIVGYNGAGKSTLIKLLCRLYEPTEGVILYNGIDISTIKYDQYMELLSVVFQDYRLFAFSIKDNVILNRAFDKIQLDTAISKSGLSKKVSGLENGIDTLVSKEFDEKGIEFSGGEQQKLASARAFYKNAPIVILDEPTSALDPVSESELYQRFNDIIGKNTAVYITHRLASVKFCDTIAVFSNGMLIEYGSHEELMKHDGLYSEMFSKQAIYYNNHAQVEN